MQQRMQLVALGDSVTVGHGFSGVTAETSYTQRLQGLLDLAQVPVQVLPSAIEGIDTGYALKRFNRLVTLHEPDLVLVLLGLNDAVPPGQREAASPDSYEQNLLGIVDRILSLDARPILATPNPRFALTCETHAERLVLMAPYAAAVRRIAAHFQLGCIDLNAHLGAQADLPGLIPDGIHPGPVAHRLIAEHLASVLVPMLGGQPQPPTVTVGMSSGSATLVDSAQR